MRVITYMTRNSHRTTFFYFYTVEVIVCIKENKTLTEVNESFTVLIFNNLQYLVFMKNIRFIDLFAGLGGTRIGFELACKELVLRRLAIPQVLILLLILAAASNSVYAGSGAGGQIRIVNKSLSEINAVWSGAGCAGIYGGVAYSCHSEIIQPGESYLYRYNWGVTTTFIAASKYNSEGCGTFTYDKNLCIYKNWIIDTDAYDTDRVTIYSMHTESPPEDDQGVSQQKVSESETFWYSYPSVRE